VYFSCCGNPETVTTIGNIPKKDRPLGGGGTPSHISEGNNGRIH